MPHLYASRRRYSRAGTRSIASATTMPITGPSVHRPPNQCCTAVYQSSVVGRKMKPARSQSSEENIPSNQRVKNQRSATTRRGARRVTTPKKCGIQRSLLLFPQDSEESVSDADPEKRRKALVGRECV